METSDCALTPTNLGAMPQVVATITEWSFPWWMVMLNTGNGNPPGRLFGAAQFSQMSDQTWTGFNGDFPAIPFNSLLHLN